jgi:hypothetical protein
LDKSPLLPDNFLVGFETGWVVLFGALCWCSSGCGSPVTPLYLTAVPSTVAAQMTTSPPIVMTTPAMPPTGAPASTSLSTSSATPVLVTPERLSPPTSAARPTPFQTTLQSAGALRVYEDKITLNVYPYAGYLTWMRDSATGVPFAALDRRSYDASLPSPRLQSYKVVILENSLLRMRFIPELGGRLYHVTYKPTNQGIFYNNPVVKPSTWGPLDSAHNWWLALGGIEWAFPVQEHGYEWGSAWAYRTQADANAVSIVLSDSDAPDRMRVTVTVTLRAGEAGWTIAPQVENPLPQSVSAQFWLNAMLTLGAETIPPDTQFTLPTYSARVHSTGDERVPGEHSPVTWPMIRDVNFAQYVNWQNHLGIFAGPLTGNTLSASSAQTHLQLTRTFPAAQAMGVKLFAFGPRFADRSYTDNGSQYFELWGGPNKSFWPEDNVTIQTGAKLGWSETWSVTTVR